VHAEDCKDPEAKEPKTGKIDLIERKIELHGQLDAAQRTRLIEIANKCPVHKTLTTQIRIETREITATG
jgi:putative redox protein